MTDRENITVTIASTRAGAGATSLRNLLSLALVSLGAKAGPLGEGRQRFMLHSAIVDVVETVTVRAKPRAPRKKKRGRR